MKIVLCITSISRIQTESQRHDLTGVVTCAALFPALVVMVKDSVALCTQLVQKPKKLK